MVKSKTEDHISKLNRVFDNLLVRCYKMLKIKHVYLIYMVGIPAERAPNNITSFVKSIISRL